MNSVDQLRLSSSRGQPLRVCLVEDDPDQAAWIEQVLKQAGYEVVNLQGVETFADYLQHTSVLPDAVLMDLVLPEGPLAGLNYLSEVTQQSGQSIPLIVMSARDDLAARLAASRAGALAYFSKPLNFSLLPEQIQGLLWQEPQMKLLILAEESVEFLGTLQQENVEIQCLQDVKEVMLALDLLAPDVILIDTAVASIPCLDLVAVLSELPMPRKRPVILLDRLGHVNSVQALAAGAQDWISWPSAECELWPRLQLHARQFYRQQQLHQQMQHLIAEREREHQALNVHAIVSRTDPSGRITYVNEKFCQISGYSEAELIGQNHRLLKSGQHPDSYYQEIWRVISSGRVWQGEICNRRKDGTFYWVDSTIMPFFNDRNEIREYVSIRMDITALKSAKQELQASKSDLEQLLWEKGERVKESNCLNRITDYLVSEKLSDQAIMQMIVDEMPYGWAYPDYTHVGIFYAGEWFTSNDYQNSEVMLKKSLNLPGFAEADQAWIEVHLESSSALPRSFLTEELQLLEEISTRIETYFTQRRMTQDLIKAKEEAQTANQAKSNFLSSMSHELRTPLNAVLGFAQLLQCDEELSADQLDSVNEILNSGEHLLALINEILDLARMESDK